MQEAEGVTEALKAANQMEWVQRMNNIRNRAEEIIWQQLFKWREMRSVVYPYRVLCYSKTNILSFSASYQLPEAAIHTFCEQCQKSEYVQVKCVLTSTSSEKNGSS